MKRKILAAIRSVLLVPPFFVLTIVFAGLVILFSRKEQDAPATDRILEIWSRLFLAIPPVTYTVVGAANADPDQQYVVVTNHLSNFDIPLVLLAVPGRVRFLAKKELFKIPLFGPAMAQVGVVKIDRKAGMSVHDAIFEAAADSLDRGYWLLVFAEGTRSSDGEMAPFKKGAFRIAIDNDLPILPVVLEGTHEVNPPGSVLIYPGRAQVSILEPVETDGLTRADVPELSNQIRASMLAEYDRLRAKAQS
jgi:1-acyl-sn-glycerol-3-phosphate acyltransferase